MSLANMAWSRVNVHEVVAEFLRGERHRFEQILSPAAMASLIDSPNIRDPYANHNRFRYLLLSRRYLIGEIPPDTRWYEVRNLTDNELSELHVIARCGWDHADDRNELPRVALRRPSTLTDQPGSWARPILWGHKRAGPFTILEGNNRLTAYVSQGRQSGLMIPTLVGLSPTPCCFHIFDPPNVVANDLWKTA
jgi:hypothetical protein